MITIKEILSLIGGSLVGLGFLWSYRKGGETKELHIKNEQMEGELNEIKNDEKVDQYVDSLGDAKNADLVQQWGRED